MRWSSSTRYIREPHLFKRFIYQLATYKRATIRDHATHGSPIHTRKLDPWRPRGEALIGQKGLFSTAYNSQIRPKTRTVAGRMIFFSFQESDKPNVPPQKINTHETVGGLQGGPWLRWTFLVCRWVRTKNDLYQGFDLAFWVGFTNLPTNANSSRTSVVYSV